MWSELIADNAHTDFDSENVGMSNPKPTIGFTSMAQEGMMLIMWTRIPIADDYKPKQKKEKERNFQSL